MNERKNWEHYGDYNRFHITKFTGRDGNDSYMVRDASWVTDDDLRAGHRSPTVAQFATLEEARRWCNLVEEGKITSVPHEANFEGWPELKARVQRRGRIT